MTSARLQVHLIAATQFFHVTAEALTGWGTDANGGQALAEFAGRACYESWHKPSEKTATNAGYLQHILEVGHLSVLEHGSASFYFTGVSRSLTHELVRHRHFSYSQLSQRYVEAKDTRFVVPPGIADDPELVHVVEDFADEATATYQYLLGRIDHKLAELPVSTGKKKAARQAARSVLLNATETKIVVTGNYRAWRHFIAMRATAAADVEIRALAIECLRKLQFAAPNVFSDFKLSELGDGTLVASSPYVSGAV